MRSFSKKLIASILCISMIMACGCSKGSDRDDHERKPRETKSRETTAESSEESDESSESSEETEPSEETTTETTYADGTYFINWPYTNYYTPTNDPNAAALFIASIAQSRADAFAMAFFDDFVDMDNHQSNVYGTGDNLISIGTADLNRDGLVDSFYTYQDYHVGIVLSSMNNGVLATNQYYFEHGPASCFSIYDDGEGNYYFYDLYATVMAQFSLSRIDANGLTEVANYVSEYDDNAGQPNITVTCDGNVTVFHDYDGVQESVDNYYGIHETTFQTMDYRECFIECDHVDDALVNAIVNYLSAVEGNYIYSRDDFDGNGHGDIQIDHGQLSYVIYVYDNGFKVCV